MLHPTLSSYSIIELVSTFNLHQQWLLSPIQLLSYNLRLTTASWRLWHHQWAWVQCLNPIKRFLLTRNSTVGHVFQEVVLVGNTCMFRKVMLGSFNFSYSDRADVCNTNISIASSTKPGSCAWTESHCNSWVLRFFISFKYIIANVLDTNNDNILTTTSTIDITLKEALECARCCCSQSNISLSVLRLKDLLKVKGEGFMPMSTCLASLSVSFVPFASTSE